MLYQPVFEEVSQCVVVFYVQTPSVEIPLALSHPQYTRQSGKTIS